MENPRESDADNDSSNLYWRIVVILTHREFSHFIGEVLEIVAGYTSDRTLPVLCKSNYFDNTTTLVRIALADLSLIPLLSSDSLQFLFLFCRRGIGHILWTWCPVEFCIAEGPYPQITWEHG